MLAISMRRNRVRYWLVANSRSSSSSWVLEKAVRIRLQDSVTSQSEAGGDRGGRWCLLDRFSVGLGNSLNDVGVVDADVGEEGW